MPLTWNEPPPPLTVPAEVVASPQSMVAVKSLATAVVRVSEKVATTVVKLAPEGAAKRPRRAGEDVGLGDGRRVRHGGGAGAGLLVGDRSRSAVNAPSSS